MGSSRHHAVRAQGPGRSRQLARQGRECGSIWGAASHLHVFTLYRPVPHPPARLPAHADGLHWDEGNPGVEGERFVGGGRSYRVATVLMYLSGKQGSRGREPGGRRGCWVARLWRDAALWLSLLRGVWHVLCTMLGPRCAQQSGLRACVGMWRWAIAGSTIPCTHYVPALPLCGATLALPHELAGEGPLAAVPALVPQRCAAACLSCPSRVPADAEEGGETAFPHGEWLDEGVQTAGRTFSECAARGPAAHPRKGDAVLFWDMVPSGDKLDRYSMHSGCPVIKGIKWRV